MASSLVEPWNEWLQSAVRRSKSKLGAQWSDVYLTSPVWRFVLSPGACGETAHAGVLMSSFDKAGQHFPLTIAVPLPGTSNPFRIAIECESWFARAETLALSVLDDTDFDFVAFDEQVEQTLLDIELAGDFPDLAEGAPDFPDGAPAWQIGLGPPQSLGACFNGLLGRTLKNKFPTMSLWWTGGSVNVPPNALVCEAIPPPAGYAAMLDGDWKRWGWESLSVSSEKPAHSARAEAADLVYFSAAVSDVGNVRKLNEDAFLERPEIGLWVVADGLGGHEAGDMASGLIVESLRKISPSDDLNAMVNDVKERIGDINDRLRMLAHQDEVAVASGSTLAALLASGSQCACVWAGDSRVYRLRDGVLTQLTRDHSELQALIDQGEIQRADAVGYASHVITRAVGGVERLVLDLEFLEMRAGDRYLLCTDGLYGDLSKAEIAAELSGDQPDFAAHNLVAQVLSREARDNVTVVVVQVNDKDIGLRAEQIEQHSFR